MLIMGVRYNADLRNPYIIATGSQHVSISDANVPIGTKREWLFQHGLLHKNEIDALMLDSVALYSVCPEQQATNICNSISSLPKLDKLTKPVITDACACVGGNTLAFVLCGLFSMVNAVEIDKTRKSMLDHNLSVIKHRSPTPVRVYGIDYLKLMYEQQQDIVYIDPPWGGPGYQYKPKLQLFLGGKHLAEIMCVLHENTCNTGTKYVVFRAPLNFDVDDMNSRLRKSKLSMSVCKRFKKYSLYYVDVS